MRTLPFILFSCLAPHARGLAPSVRPLHLLRSVNAPCASRRACTGIVMSEGMSDEEKIAALEKEVQELKIKEQ